MTVLKDSFSTEKVLFFSLLHRRIRYEWELGLKCQCRLQMEGGNEEEGIHNTARCRNRQRLRQTAADDR